MQRLRHQFGQRTVAVDGFRTAAQDDRIARLDRQRRGFDGDIGAALINHAEDPERDAHLPHADAAGTAVHAVDFAHRIGQRSDLLAALRHLLDHLVRQGEPIDKGRLQPGLAGGVKVAQIGVLKSRSMCADRCGQRQQRPVLLCGAGTRHVARGGPRARAQVGHQGVNLFEGGGSVHEHCKKWNKYVAESGKWVRCHAEGISFPALSGFRQLWNEA
ncbi:hypothetical protein GALL_441170 [mine drainage metagenome]|uniref:Uncharacterized protein n=1 Tax=mine drainage metagenome TaxID=410659 RepID=A0A1J5PSY1_9ZZZZ